MNTFNPLSQILRETPTHIATLGINGMALIFQKSDAYHKGLPTFLNEVYLNQIDAIFEEINDQISEWNEIISEELEYYNSVNLVV